MSGEKSEEREGGNVTEIGREGRRERLRVRWRGEDGSEEKVEKEGEGEG